MEITNDQIKVTQKFYGLIEKKVRKTSKLILLVSELCFGKN